ncbi:MAG: LysR family transcriptional regulator [Candidatus Eisenbacteria bacterium]|nr:LysR family transcriptional regulator [Candidatus Eisenbacteria bacterium]
MNLRQVEIFLSVIEHGSFSAAARGSHVTQSTISQHVAALEEELGVQLLERSRNGVRLTDGGRILQRHARRLLGELRSTETAFRRFRGLEEATLRIGASTIPATYLVPTVLARLCEQFPTLDAVVLHGDSRETSERIASREVEVGVVGARVDERGFTFAVAGSDRIRLIVYPGHPWIERRSISLSDLSEARFVAREAGSGTGRAVIEALRLAGVDTDRLRIRAEVGNSEALKGLVMARLGVGFVSDLAIRREVERGELAVVEVDELVIERPFYLARQSGRELAPASAAFWDLMVSTHGRGGQP